MVSSTKTHAKITANCSRYLFLPRDVIRSYNLTFLVLFSEYEVGVFLLHENNFDQMFASPFYIDFFYHGNFFNFYQAFPAKNKGGRKLVIRMIK